MSFFRSIQMPLLKEADGCVVGRLSPLPTYKKVRTLAPFWREWLLYRLTDRAISKGLTQTELDMNIAVGNCAQQVKTRMRILRSFLESGNYSAHLDS
jgi:hypothetical protein